jgi:quinol monooxygenase YgiN
MIAVLDAKPGQADALRQLITELVAQVRREPGCVTFTPYQDHGHPGRFYLYEVYANLPAFRQHLRTPHVRRFIAALPTFSTSSGAAALTQLDEILVPAPR